MVSQPYYQDDYVTLYHGDSLEVLPTLDIKADVLLTDPAPQNVLHIVPLQSRSTSPRRDHGAHYVNAEHRQPHEGDGNG